jgi:hypothetical protein
LSPLVIVLSLLAGGSLAGLLGVVVAVPTVTVLRICIGHLWRTRVLGESWAEASMKMIETTDGPERLWTPQGWRRPGQTKFPDTTELEVVEADIVTVPVDTPGR